VFRLKSAAGRQIENLCYIGRCECNKEFRHVYACLCESVQEAHSATEKLSDPKKVGCVLFPTHYGKTFERLKRKGIASVALRECLTLRKDGFHGECPVNCADCLLPADTQLESRLDTIEKTVLPDASRGSKTKRSASDGGKVRAAAYREKITEARRFILKYHRENRSMCFTQALRKAAQHLDLGESTLKKHIKKRDFPDW
jgi:hypothetical protein